MSDLLLDLFTSESNPPVALNIKVNPQLKPFLVSSSKSLAWTERLDNDLTMAASRPLGENIQAEVVAALVERSIEMDWGNLFSHDSEGCNEAITYLRERGFSEIHVLVNPNSDLESIDEEGVELIRASWVPLGCAVFVPEQREYLGNLVVFQNGVSVFITEGKVLLLP